MYTPGQVPSDTKDIPGFLTRELQSLAQALQAAQDALFLTTLYAEPSRLYDGLVVKADGTTWNPGSGAGVYAYYGSAWNFLG